MGAKKSLLQRLLLPIFILFVFLQNSCFAEKNMAEFFKNAPEDVLVGTDVQLLKSFKSAGKINKGEYVADMGGATLNLSIESNDNTLKLKRIFQEPGLAKEKKSYVAKSVKNIYIDNTEISVVSIKDGVLLLEKNSNSDGIPGDMWVLYTEQ